MTGRDWFWIAVGALLWWVVECCVRLYPHGDEERDFTESELPW